MKTWLSDNELWEIFGTRALFETAYGGADFGEVEQTLTRIGRGDRADWHREWTATANRVETAGDQSAAGGHRVSAREAYIRATTYHRTAYYPFFGPTLNDRLASSAEREWQALQKVLPLMDPPAEPLQIPYEDTHLPGIFLSGGAGRRPTVICVNGYDSSMAEMLVEHGVAATSRGYHALLFDGPGQGRALTDQGLALRHDWEAVVASVLDFAEQHPQVDRARMVLHGWSLGGYLAPRAAAFHADRLAALVPDPGQWDMRLSLLPLLHLPDDRKAAFPEIDREEVQPVEDFLNSPKAPPALHWKMIQRAQLVHQTDNLFDSLMAMDKLQLSPVVSGIACPTLVILAEEDPVAAQAETLFNAIPAKIKKLQRFTAEEGAGDHTELRSRRLFHQRMYDWLDDLLGL
ncbi:alpha/beta hydrolase family protein [Rhodovibrionaceae bacterium A322]